jgi:phosphatidylglycerophosphatase A
MSARTDPPPSGSAGSPDALARAPADPTASGGSSTANSSAPPNASGSESSNLSVSAGAAVPSPTSANQPPRRKPRISLFIATACGLGYLPKAPGTWGSLAAIPIYYLIVTRFPLDIVPWQRPPRVDALTLWALMTTFSVALVIALLGIWASGQTARFTQNDDPQFVVIDEVSGQLLTYLVALAPANWKYLLLGFILFRVFDIWKPFPARQAEALPGGWGIMADDWIAGIYAGLGLWIARALGL